jgi:hypothetical protein
MADDALVQIKLALMKIEDRLEDGTLIVLKGHLVLEELMRMKVDAVVKNPEFLARANLSFFQLLYIARALFPDDARTQLSRGDRAVNLWEIIEAWNQLRNQLAHRLEPTNTLIRSSRLASSACSRTDAGRPQRNNRDAHRRAGAFIRAHSTNGWESYQSA